MPKEVREELSTLRGDMPRDGLGGPTVRERWDAVRRTRGEAEHGLQRAICDPAWTGSASTRVSHNRILTSRVEPIDHGIPEPSIHGLLVGLCLGRRVAEQDVAEDP